MINIQHADVYQPRGGHVYPPHVYYYPRGPQPFPPLVERDRGFRSDDDGLLGNFLLLDVLWIKENVKLLRESWIKFNRNIFTKLSKEV